jgi:hypothetical protein
MPEHLTIGGWIFLCLGWGSIGALTAYCFRHILGEKRDEIVDPVPPELDHDA